MNIFKKTLTLIVGNPKVAGDLRMPKNRSHKTKKLTERELIKLESEIGSKLFGEIPAGHRREFFCLDADTWIWYEEWIDPQTKKTMQTTTRYEVLENGILKVLEGARYTYIEGDELKNLTMAIRLYHDQVARNIYKRDPQTGKPLAA